jgi:hypothetical protein
MKILKNKKQKIFTILLISLLTLIVSIYVVFEKPTAEVNQHPMPWLIGSLEHPEYKEGGCYNFYDVFDRTTELSIINGEITHQLVTPLNNLKYDQSRYTYLDDVKEILNNMSEYFLSNSIVVREESYIQYLDIRKDSWDSIDLDLKTKELNKIQTLIRSIFPAYEIYIYSCLNGVDTWVAYISNTSGEDILRFDWRESIWEQFVRKLKNDWR